MNIENSTRKIGNKLLICDPVCVLPFGHAMPALNHFRRQLSSSFEKVECIASSEFDSDLAIENNFSCHFRYLYNRYIKIMGRARFEQGLREAANFNAADPYEQIATEDSKSLMDSHNVDEGDVIFMPGGDFYGILGLLNACSQRPREKCPKIFIRLIAVLETSTEFHDDPLSTLCARLSKAHASGLRLYLSAETPAYADKLSRLTGLATYVTPYPETSVQVEMPVTSDFVVASVGSARLDKGFQDLAEIMRGVSALTISKNVKLISQMLPVFGNEAWDLYTCRLYAMAGVKLLPAALSTSEIERLYKTCNLVVLPYAPDVYRDRGSAVLMEAASIGRPCITLRGTAFALQVEYYGLGTVVDTIAEIPAAIKYYAEMPAEELSIRIFQSRTRFFLDIAASYDAWFMS